MARTHEEWLQDEANARAFAAEELILDVTEKIWELLERDDVSKTDLAERLGKSKAYVSQLLNGSRNMTLRTLADIAYVLGEGVEFRLESDADDWIGDWEQLHDCSSLRMPAAGNEEDVPEGEYGAVVLLDDLRRRARAA